MMLRSLTLKLAVAFFVVTFIATMLGVAIVGTRVFDSFDNFLEAPPPRQNDDNDNDNNNGNNDNGGRNNNRNSNRGPVDRRFLPDTAEGNFENDVYVGIIFGLGSGTILATLIGIWFARRLVRPLRELTSASHQLTEGNLGHQVIVNSRDEVGELGVAFNMMSAELERSNRLRQQLTADIAHDLRTPLSVISGYTEALSDGKLAGTNKIYGVMHHQVRHLQHLLDDLRTLSLADAGELSLEKRLIDPRILLEQTALTYFQQAENNSIKLEVNTADQLPLISVDTQRIIQVTNNLVSNAIRYTPPHGIISLSAAKGANQMLIIKVADTGEGIPAEDLPNIFERFYRVDEARERTGGESGLGLAIAKSIIDAHGGDISVESTVDEGTTFTILVPHT